MFEVALFISWVLQQGFVSGVGLRAVLQHCLLGGDDNLEAEIITTCSRLELCEVHGKLIFIQSQYLDDG